MKFSDLIDDFYIKYVNSPVVRGLLLPFYRYYVRLTEGKNNNTIKESFDKYGLEAIGTFDKCLTNNDFPYILAFGTMLGAVREHGFIKYDHDIDVIMWIEDYSSTLIDILEGAGFKLVHSFTVDNDKCAKEDTFEYKGVQIDIFYFYPPIKGRSFPYCCDFHIQPGCRTRRQSVRQHGGLLPRRIELPLSKDIIRVPFDNLKLPIPSNADEFLKCRYGIDYMTPNPTWVNKVNDFIVVWSEKIAVYKEY